MKFAPAMVFASALTVLTAGNTSANDAEKRALYSALNVLTFINKDTSAELKVTAAQEKGLQAGKAKRDKLWVRYCEEAGKLERSKLSESEKNAKQRTLETQLSDDLFKSYGETLRPEQVKRIKQIVLQVRGMEMFDYPEVREALNIGDKEVKVLRAAYDKMGREMLPVLQENVKAKRMTNVEAARIAGSMAHSVPEKVRESLSDEQKKVLEELLGPKYNYGR